MKVTATLDGASVTIVNISSDGSGTLISYITAGGLLQSKRVPWPYQQQYSGTLASSAVSVS
jgi:hypothetical protein